MALIKCPHCGGTVSDQAPQCPHCNELLVEIILHPDNDNPKEPVEIDIPSMYGPPYPDPIIDDSVFNTTSDDPEFVIATTSQPTAKSAGSRALLYVVIALLLAAACGVGVYIFLDRKHKSNAADKTAAAPTLESAAEAVETDDWDDDLGCEVYDPIPAGAEHLYGNVYAVSTEEWEDECYGWIKPLLPGDTRSAAVFADRIWLRSSMSTDDNSNKLALLEYGTRLDVISMPDNKWAEVRVSGGEHHGSRGYAAMEFIVSAEFFAIMDSHITPDVASRETLSTAKWRRALTAAVVQYGWAGLTDGLRVSTPYKIDMSPRQMIAFRIFDPSDYTAFMAYIEFFDGDEEYRLLGCTADCSIRDITCTSLGVYRLELDFSRSLD